MGVEVLVIGTLVLVVLFKISEGLKQIAAHLEKIAKKGDGQP